MERSKDLTPQDAAIKIMELASADEITAFIEGETRRSVVKGAEARIKEIATAAPRNDKPGEQKDPITQKTNDFKDGIQGTKSGDSPDSTPSPLEPSTPRSYVTCEDVIEKMRKAGRKI